MFPFYEPRDIVGDLIRLEKHWKEMDTQEIPVVVAGWALKLPDGRFYGTSEGKSIRLFMHKEDAEAEKNALGYAWQVLPFGLVELEIIK